MLFSPFFLMKIPLDARQSPTPFPEENIPHKCSRRIILLGQEPLCQVCTSFKYWLKQRINVHLCRGEFHLVGEVTYDLQTKGIQDLLTIPKIKSLPLHFLSHLEFIHYIFVYAFTMSSE